MGRNKANHRIRKSYWLIGILVAAALLGLYYLHNTPGSSAFEAFPGSLNYSLEAQSGESSSGGYIVKANPGDTVRMWIRVKNLSNNPKSQVWYGKSALIPEGERYPNAHAIGVGVFEPLDWQPQWIDPNSFVIHGNRLTYYDGPPVYRGQTIDLAWDVKVRANCPPSVQELRLNLVREFDTWGNKTNGDKSIAWRFIVAGGGDDLDRINTSSEMGSYKTAKVNGFSIQQVTINLNHPDLKIITDSAVKNDKARAPWPLLSLDEFVYTNHAFAGIHGSYFCPIEYSDCKGAKANTFYPMVYNTKIGKMINADRSGYNKGGILVFDTKNKPYFFSSTKEFDSVASFEKKYNVKIQAAISNVPMLVYKGQINYGNGQSDLNSDTKMRTAKSSRAAIGIKGYEAYLVVAYNATVPDLAQIMRSMGMDYALNLDGGGSTALYYNGFKAGPGRNIANAILFAKK